MRISCGNALFSFAFPRRDYYNEIIMKTSKILLSIAMFFIAGTLVFAAKVTKVACVGDSITFGYLIPTRTTEAYPIILGQFLGEDFEVRNFGNPGKTAGDYLGQKGRWLGANKEHKDCVDFEADIIISNLGINDTGAWWDAKLFVEGYEKLISDWLGGEKPRKGVKYLMWTELAPDFRGAKGAKAYPGNVFDGYDFPARDNGTAARHKEIHKIIAKIAKKADAIGIDAYTPLHSHPEMYLPDGLHPNAKGARRMAEFTFAALMKNKVVKLRNPAPRIVPAKDGKSVTLKNSAGTAIVLDGGALVCGGAKFVFENSTVIAPEGELVVALGGNADQKDPGFPLVSKTIKNASGIKFVPKK